MRILTILGLVRISKTSHTVAVQRQLPQLLPAVPMARWPQAQTMSGVESCNAPNGFSHLFCPMSSASYISPATCHPQRNTEILGAPEALCHT